MPFSALHLWYVAFILTNGQGAVLGFHDLACCVLCGEFWMRPLGWVIWWAFRRIPRSLFISLTTHTDPSACTRPDKAAVQRCRAVEGRVWRLRRKKGKGWLLILEACRQVHTDAHIVDCPKGLNGITEHAHSTLSPEAESEEELEPLDEDERGKWKGGLKTQQSKN